MVPVICTSNSPANPWLDFLDPSGATEMAGLLNTDLESYCSDSPTIELSVGSIKRLYAFGVLPLVPSVPISSILQSISQVASLPHLRGVIMGTKGIGKGLDDDDLEPVWEALAKEQLVVFLHPHYGVDAAWGSKDNGHVLPLALGFPFETTTVSVSSSLVLVKNQSFPTRLLHVLSFLGC
jgi:aminocarboxymuconate-semialdehyde decarboxylase